MITNSGVVLKGAGSSYTTGTRLRATFARPDNVIFMTNIYSSLDNVLGAETALSEWLAVPGNLIIGNGAAGPATARFNRSGTMNASATITVNANGLLDLNGNDQTVPRLNLNDGGDVQTGAGTLGFTAGGVVSVGTLNAPQVGLRGGASISGKIALPVLDYLTFE